MGSLARASRRHLLRHPGQLLLQVLGIALGIAAVISIDIALIGAERSFERSVSGVIGEATHAIVAGSDGFEEGLYRKLRVERRLRASAPIIEGDVQVVPPADLSPEARAAHPFAREPVRTILGVDLYAESTFRPIGGSPGRGNGAAMVTTPGGAILEESAAATLGVTVGDHLPVEVGGRITPLTIVATWRATDDLTRSGAARLIAVDIATAQELLGKVGRLDRIDLRLDLPHSPSPETVAAWLPPAVELVRATERTRTFDGMTAAFRFNLQALGLLSLVIGVFLIHQTITVSVLGRRGLWGRMRAAGVTRAEIVRLVLGEALTLGIIGSALGIIAGSLLGRGLMRVVLRTLEDLYLVVGEAPIPLDPLAIGKALTLGVGASVLSALVPALEASRADLRPVLQRSSIEVRARRGSWIQGVVALGFFALCAALIAIPGGGLVPGYGSLLALLLGFACLTPLATRAIVAVLARALGPILGGVGRMTLRGISARLSRTGLAIAALSVAISMSIGVATMVGSFRTTLIAWLDDTLPADVYCAAPSPVGRLGSLQPLPDAVEVFCRAHPAAGRVITTRWTELPSPTLRGNTASTGSPGRVRIAVLSDDSPADLGLPLETPLSSPEERDRWLGRGPAGSPPAILVSEPFARRHTIGRGDPLTVRTAIGPVDCTVLGVFRDYSSDLGYVAITRSSYAPLGDAPGQTGVALFLAEGHDPERVADEIRTRFATLPGLAVRPTAALRQATLRIFDRSFQVTEAIRLLAVVVAAIGVFGALVSLALERRHEFGVLRAHGITTREWSALILGQTALLGAIAGVIAVPLGIASAALLTRVVNERSFGWTIDLSITLAPLVTGVLVAVGAALLGGIVPAVRMARTPVTDALREVES